jgi:hypothetical protein
MTKHKINPDIFSVLNADERSSVLGSILPALMDRWDEEEAAKMRDRRRVRLCKFAGGTFTHHKNKDGCSGSVYIDMPTMDCDALEIFCDEVLRMRLADVEGGPGKMYQHTSVYPAGKGSYLRVFYGLDI